MKTRLTGKKRYTVLTRFMRQPVLVLQLEEESEYEHYSNTGGIIDCETIRETNWRNARVEDYLDE